MRAVISIGIYKKRNSNHQLLVVAVFPDLKMKLFWSINYMHLILGKSEILGTIYILLFTVEN